MQKTIHDPGDVVVWDKAYPRQDKKISPESEDKEKSKGEIITGRKSKTGCNHNDDRGRDDEHAEEEELPRREATSAGGAKFDEEKDNKNATNDPAKAPTLTQLKHELACGRLGEQILEQKVAGADAFAILIGFLLAFVVEKLLSLNPSDFQNHLWFKVYTSMLGIASACGFSCVLALTFLGAKIRRLSGRSLYLFGSSDEDVDALAAAVGEPEITKRVLSVRKANAQTSGTSERSTQGKLALHARTWYYANAKVSTKWKWYSDVTKIRSYFDRLSCFCPPHRLYANVFPLFQIMLICFLGAICVKQIDALEQDHAWLAHLNNLVTCIGPMVMYFFLCRCGATEDLS